MTNFLKACVARNPIGPAGAIALIAGFAFTVALGEDAAKKPADAWIAPARAARKANPVLADAKSMANGNELFVGTCLPCHGPAGKGDGPVAATLERDGTPVRPGNLSDPKLWQQSDGAIFWKISEGRSPMPAFQEALSEEQRWQIVNYVRTLAPKQANKNKAPTSGGK